MMILNKKRIRRALLGVLVALGLTAVVAGGAFLYIEHEGNFHTVEKGIFYRSAQLKGDDLHQVFKLYGIKSVLNLRGPKSGVDWYDEEVDVCRRDGVKHFDYRISASHVLTMAQMSEILKIIKAAPKPILVHCKSGADRTGLVSALYRVSQGQEISQAEKELSIRYGHFPYLGSSTIAMDESLRIYVTRAGTNPIWHGQR